MGINIYKDIYNSNDSIILKSNITVYDTEVIKQINDIEKDLICMSNQDILEALFDYVEKKKVESINSGLSQITLKLNFKVVDELPYEFEADLDTIYVTSKDYKQYIINEDKSEWIDLETREEKEVKESSEELTIDGLDNKINDVTISLDNANSIYNGAVTTTASISSYNDNTIDELKERINKLEDKVSNESSIIDNVISW